MNLDELQSVQSRERQTDSLQQLRESFYEDAGEYIQQLRDEREGAAERADDPFDSPEVNRLTDDIKTAEQTVEAIYERRVGKVVKMASLAAADMPTEDEGLTREERDLFETLVTAIEENREHVLDVLAGEASPGAVTGSPATSNETPSNEATSNDVTASTGGVDTSDPETSDAPPSNESATGDARATDDGSGAVEGTDDATASVDAADLMSGDGDASSTDGGDGVRDDDGVGDDDGVRDGSGDGVQRDGDRGENVDRRTVRITDDVGAIFGVDEREYDLSTDDVVTLPAANADPLVERDAAEPLE